MIASGAFTVAVFAKRPETGSSANTNSPFTKNKNHVSAVIQSENKLHIDSQSEKRIRDLYSCSGLGSR